MCRAAFGSFSGIGRGKWGEKSCQISGETLKSVIMNAKEILQYLKENDLDCCPECGNRKNNQITINPPGEEDTIAIIVCEKCQLCWGEEEPEK